MLSENLKRIREEQRYDRTSLGKLAGCHAATIKGIETGKNENPRIKTLLSLAKVLKVSINTLLK